MMLPEDVVTEFEAVVEDAQCMAFFARASELQKQAVNDIEHYLPKLADLKAAAVKDADDTQANLILTMELGLRGVQAEIRMWLLLKQDKPDEAWEELITAQGCVSDMVRVRRQLGIDASGPENLLAKLEFIEKGLFPPQVFCSIGGTASRRECSICHADYDCCDHIKGRAYMGEICCVTVNLYECKEVSLTDNPANKRCRLTHFSCKGGMRNKMTWRVEAGKSE
jgi:hypothetical protein